MSSDVSAALRQLVAERAYHVCEYCLVHELDVYHGCEVDHVISVKHGGLSVPGNLAYACFHCNRHKGTDLGSIGLRTGKFVAFFNPRSDRWKQHFYVNEARIDALTETGEVTSRMLEFNHPERLAFRRLLVAIGRYLTVEALARIRE
jgi:HNH endonuclease